MQNTTARNLLLISVVTLALAGAPRGAHACGSGHYPPAGIVLVALGATVADITFTAFDVGSGLLSHQPSKAYGIVETLVAAPQFALGLALLSSQPNSGGFAPLYTLWMGLLTVHGVVTIATAPCTATNEFAPSPPPPPDEPEPGLQLRIGPTYVPVGQLAQTGFGVVGRF